MCVCVHVCVCVEGEGEEGRNYYINEDYASLDTGPYDRVFMQFDC